MRIDPETGELFLGPLRIYAGMTPNAFGNLEGFRPNSSVGDESWWWTRPLEGIDWTPFFVQTGLFSTERLFCLTLRPPRTDDEGGKAANDALLRQILGPESNAASLRTSLDGSPFHAGRPSWIDSAHSLAWSFPWGEATSSVEPRDWTPLITILWRRHLPDRIRLGDG